MPDEIQEILDAYDVLVKGIDQSALANTKGRAYGGIVRAGKGELVESIAKSLVRIAWERLGKPSHRLNLDRKPVILKIQKEYLEKLQNVEVKNHIKNRISDYSYTYKPDVSVTIDGKYVIAIECKAYTENAMIKRILVDSTLIKHIHPNIISILFQLESQLGGDYSELKNVTYGSSSTHTLLSYFDIDLYIITLLKGERKVDKPIHKKQFFKPLKRESLERSINILKEILNKY